MFPKWTVKSYEKSALLFTRNVYRAWRTYGVNMGFFTEVRGYYSGPPFVLEPSSADPRRPGLAPDEPISLADPFLDEPYTEVGLAAKEALSPLLMYLGGPDGEFTRKDRAFFSGEKVRKAVVVLNDRDRPAAVSGAWQLCDASGKAVLQGTLPETRLQPGELAPARIHVEFETPAVDSRADFTLRLNGKADAEGALNDEVRLAVFPRPAKPALGKGVEVFLYDPVGETRAVLERAGVKHTLLAGTLPDPTTSLLVVGRNALKAEAHRAAFAKLLYARMGHDFGVNTTNGMRVLVFEQALDNVWGLKTEQTRWRRAWPLAPGHPALAGLGPDDLIYLRGDSNLAEPYPPAPPGKAGRVATDRFSEWGNDNVVSTYTFLRPQLGAMRALVACGFDQQETPLLEAAAGKGRLMFCQFDVTNRYGLDPVSTRLVHNLLTYMTAAPPPDPSVGQPVDLVREGWEDYPLDIKTEKRFFMADKPPGPISWGISAADLYFEGFLDLPVIQAADGKKSLYAALPGKNRFAHVLNRRHFPTKWQKMKAQMVRAALEINQGGSSEV
ncbi:MAG: hypothetical protein FJ278_18400, partial [Planctomycetes bacterium]|nr:hypothetical protein [Planctomycetota bacterium]